MYRIAEFFMVSENRYSADFLGRGLEGNPLEAYMNVKIPRRATSGSAGYDFVTPFDLELKPGESKEIPTGIRVKMQEGWVFMIYPRSGLGYKYHTVLANTVRIIDSDYYYADNEGHIIIKMINESTEGKTLSLKAGDRFAQGVFTQYGVTMHDNESEQRKGGFGSTSKV